jgi:hypothetical protein
MGRGVFFYDFEEVAAAPEVMAFAVEVFAG